VFAERDRKAQISARAVDDALRKMVDRDGLTSNQLFDVLIEWNTYLEHRKSEDFQVPPCP
jgi:hypothetical protein